MGEVPLYDEAVQDCTRIGRWNRGSGFTHRDVSAGMNVNSQRPTCKSVAVLN